MSDMVIEHYDLTLRQVSFVDGKLIASAYVGDEYVADVMFVGPREEIRARLHDLYKPREKKHG